MLLVLKIFIRSFVFLNYDMILEILEYIAKRPNIKIEN